MFFPAADTIAFTEGGVESMRIDASGNVGIGTTAPGTRLTVAAAVEAGARFLGNGLTSAGLFVGYNSAAYVYNDSNTPLIFGTNAAERMRITEAGRVLVGLTSGISVAGATAGIQTAAVAGFIDAMRFSADSAGPLFKLVKSRSATVGTNAAVLSGDAIGQIGFIGADGTSYIFGAAITGEVDGTPGTNDMPGRLVFSTTPDGSNTPAERMRITSGGNVGIGTTAPSTTLNIYNATSSQILAQGDAAANIIVNRASSDTGRPGLVIRKSRGTVASPAAVNSGDPLGTIFFQGFGGTNIRSLSQIWGNVETYTSDTDISSNITFLTSPSGSASGVEVMRITSGGNVGIGTSSPGEKLSIAGAANVYASLLSTGGIKAQLNAADATGAGAIGTVTNHPFRLETNNTERMRIDPSGNVGIGTSSPGNAKLNTQGFGSYRGNAYTIASFAANSALAPLNIVQATDGTIPGISAGQNSSAVFNSLGFYTSEAERMRIDASGNVLVAKTTSADTTVGSAVLTNGRITSTMASSSADESGYHLYSTGAGAYRFYVNLAGTIFATSTTISAISDQRLKENVRDIDAGLPEIMALKPRKFDWKPGQGRDKKDDRGWIAQEFEQVFPDMIAEWKDPAPEGEEPYKAVNADLIPVLVKAIQEQQAQIEDLKTRIANLENR
jgi:hypothetical protein